MVSVNIYFLKFLNFKIIIILFFSPKIINKKMRKKLDIGSRNVESRVRGAHSLCVFHGSNAWKMEPCAATLLGNHFVRIN